MRNTIFLMMTLLVLPLCRPAAAGQNLLGDLAQPKQYRAMRASSSDPNWRDGNGDARPIKPGETLTLAELEGPGCIQHIWFTISASDPKFPRTTVLRMYWDDNPEPAVESPLGDFFAVGHGMLRDVNSLPVAVGSNGRAYNCYWAMPFRKSARITVTNDSDQPVGALYYYIDWAKYESLPEDTRCFHAQYRQEYPCQSGRNYLILDATGAGHYVGTVQSVWHTEPSWYGEGDDFFFIDGETEPSLRGTGTEDYFCDAWGFRELMRPFTGITVWEGANTGDRGTAYRWHVTDPIPFEKSLRVEIEHKGARLGPDGKHTSGFIERADLMSSVAFWYQVPPAVRFTELPPVSERALPATVIELDARLADMVFEPTGQVVVQELFFCSGKQQVLFVPSTATSTVEVPFEVAEPGRYLVTLKAITSFDYGIWDVFLDGELVLAKADLYFPDIKGHEFKLGARALEAGPHVLRFAGQGCNPKSRQGETQPGYLLGLDALLLTRFPEMNTPTQ